MDNVQMQIVPFNRCVVVLVERLVVVVVVRICFFCLSSVDFIVMFSNAKNVIICQVLISETFEKVMNGRILE